MQKGLHTEAYNGNSIYLFTGGLVISGNPLICGCDIAWLGPWLRRWQRELLTHNPALVDTYYLTKSVRKPTCIEKKSKKRRYLIDSIAAEVSCSILAYSRGNSEQWLASKGVIAAGILLSLYTVVQNYAKAAATATTRKQGKRRLMRNDGDYVTSGTLLATQRPRFFFDDDHPDLANRSLRFHPGQYIDSSHYQFGFKEGSSTEFCVFILKSVVQYFWLFSSAVYACYVDAKAAFDRMNLEAPCKIDTKGVDRRIIGTLHYWFQVQRFKIKWTGYFSESFHVLNGVRQGGVLSPLLSGRLDGVTANHIKHGGPSLICLLTLLFNGFLNHCYVPDSLTEVCLVPIPKSNAGDMASESFPVLNGVRQGGVLSPLLYNLYGDVLNLRLA
ncbi:hypothetical protein QYM36_012152 [Artemia franciscana]|uniref:LRRCT domain-containing protein n=1 Tax=Artemia franciscana TaxID=6661 RepID=A0AA88HTP4_ARTSF|nr:hypothetical protein QYM36_012152 [Artemia franciscana]